MCRGEQLRVGTSALVQLKAFEVERDFVSILKERPPGPEVPCPVHQGRSLPVQYVSRVLYYAHGQSGRPWDRDDD
jgi:hypothetical protein